MNQHLKVSVLRLKYGVLEIVRHPWKLLFLIAIFIAFVFIWHNRNFFDIDVPLLSQVYHIAIDMLIFIVGVLTLIGAIILIGTPINAKDTERRLLRIGFDDQFGSPPILLNTQKIKGTKAQRMIFFSLGLSKQKWIDRQHDIEDTLNITLLSEPVYGGRKNNNRNYIVLIVAKGDIQHKRSTLYDDEF